MGQLITQEHAIRQQPAIAPVSLAFKLGGNLVYAARYRADAMNTATPLQGQSIL